MAVAEFRKELLKIMPGYNWTVHRRVSSDTRMIATGIQSAGFNRLSTLEVTRIEDATGATTYAVRSAGHGTRARWQHSNRDGTLARALRGLQDHYQRTAANYQQLAERLQDGRNAEPIHRRDGDEG